MPFCLTNRAWRCASIPWFLSPKPKLNKVKDVEVYFFCSSACSQPKLKMIRIIIAEPAFCHPAIAPSPLLAVVFLFPLSSIFHFNCKCCSSLNSVQLGIRLCNFVGRCFLREQKTKRHLLSIFDTESNKSRKVHKK